MRSEFPEENCMVSTTGFVVVDRYRTLGSQAMLRHRIFVLKKALKNLRHAEGREMALAAPKNKLMVTVVAVKVNDYL